MFSEQLPHDQRTSIDSDVFFRDESAFTDDEIKPFTTANRSKVDLIALEEQRVNVIRVVHLALIFLLLFSAYNPVQNMISVLFTQIGEDYVGIFAMIIINQCNGLGNLVAPIIAPKFNYRDIFAASTVAFVTLISAGKMVSSCELHDPSFMCQTSVIYALMMAASIMTGFGMCFIWFTASIYVQECSNEHNKGRMFGLFGAINQSCNLTGALIALILLKSFGVSGFFFCQTLLSIAAAFLFLTVKKPYSLRTSREQISRVENPITIQKIIHFMNRDKMKSCIPLFILSSFSFSFFVNNLSKMTSYSVQDLPVDEANAKVGYVLIMLGISEFGASLVCGALFDKDRRFTLTMIMYFAFAVIGLNYIAYRWNIFWLYFLVAICFGFLDSGLQVCIGAMLGGRFNEKYEPFAVFRFVQGMGQAFFFLVLLILEKSWPQAMFLLYLLIAYYVWENRKGLF